MSPYAETGIQPKRHRRARQVCSVNVIVRNRQRGRQVACAVRRRTVNARRVVVNQRARCAVREAVRGGMGEWRRRQHRIVVARCPAV